MTRFSTTKNTILALLTSISIGLLLIGCETQKPQTEKLTSESDVDSLMSQAQEFENLGSINRALVSWNTALSLAFEQDNRSPAIKIASKIEDLLRTNNNTKMELSTRTQAVIMLARLSFKLENPVTALEQLSLIETSDIEKMNTNLLAEWIFQKTRGLLILSKFAEATNLLESYEAAAPQSQKTSDMIWLILSRLSETQLESAVNASDTYDSRGWLELARRVRAENYSLRRQLDAVARWRQTWAQHPAASILPSEIARLASTWKNRPRFIGVILPLKTPVGNAIKQGFLSAYYDELRISRDVPKIKFYDVDTSSDISSIYKEAAEEGVDLVIGPLDKTQVTDLSRLKNLPIQTLALNYVDRNDLSPELMVSQVISGAKFYQFGLSPEDEVKEIVSLASKAGHRTAAIITPNGPDYKRLQELFEKSWLGTGGQVVSKTNYQQETDYSSLVKEFLKIQESESRARALIEIIPRNNMVHIPRRRKDIDFIFLISNPAQARQIKPTLAFYYAENIPVYALPSIYNGFDNPEANLDLNGIVFVDAPWMIYDQPRNKQVLDQSLPEDQGILQRLRALGADAFSLYPQLDLLDSGNPHAIRGATGGLKIDDSGQIHRTLTPAIFRQGLADILVGN
ncbi:MAG: penicillin-binding protein activator [Gammaproteobacteria bacterium]|nr:penicillin-binding protein activator [Gammaproteobacteria bacterium]